MSDADTFTCCTTPMPWPTRAEDRTCPECGTVWEREPVDLGAGARIKAPKGIRVHLSEHDADLALSALLEEAFGSEDRDWARDTIALATRIRDVARRQWPGFTTSAEMYRPDLLDLLTGQPEDDRPDVPSQWVGHSDDLADEPEPDPFGPEAYKSHRPGCVCPDCRAAREPGPEAGASREYPVTLADHQWTPGPDGECIHCSRSEADHEPFGEVSPAASEAKFTIGTADPSWFPRVLRTLARDYPEINDQVWSTAIGENASELSERRAFIAVNEPVREPEPGTVIGTDVRIAYDDQDDEPEEEPPVEEYDPGPEVDDEGGMSEYRHHEPEPWS